MRLKGEPAREFREERPVNLGFHQDRGLARTVRAPHHPLEYRLHMRPLAAFAAHEHSGPEFLRLLDLRVPGCAAEAQDEYGRELAEDPGVLPGGGIRFSCPDEEPEICVAVIEHAVSGRAQHVLGCANHAIFVRRRKPPRRELAFRRALRRPRYGLLRDARRAGDKNRQRQGRYDGSSRVQVHALISVGAVLNSPEVTE